MFRKVKSVGGLANLSETNFPGLLDYYTRYVKQWQHQLMAEHYISIMSSALAKFDNNQSSPQYYKDIAWSGLMGYYDSNYNVVHTTAYSEMSNIDKQRINNSINDLKQNGKILCG
jgi:hypothetical protein